MLLKFFGSCRNNSIDGDYHLWLWKLLGRPEVLLILSDRFGTRVWINEERNRKAHPLFSRKISTRSVTAGGKQPNGWSARDRGHGKSTLACVVKKARQLIGLIAKVSPGIWRGHQQ